MSPGGTSPIQVEQRSWYGYQLILSDAISLVTLTIAATDAMVTCMSIFGGPRLDPAGCSNADNLGLVAIGGLTVVPAILHLVHGRVIAAGGSLALRLVLPTLINLATGVPALGVFAWLVGAIIDDAVLSSEVHVEERWGVPPQSWPLSRDH